MLSEMNPVTEGQILYDSIYMRSLEYQIIAIESKMVVARGWGEGEGELLFHEDSFSWGR